MVSFKKEELKFMSEVMELSSVSNYCGDSEEDFKILENIRLKLKNTLK